MTSAQPTSQSDSPGQAAVAGHAHDHCIQDALHRAERVCAARGSRLTGRRRRVLELVWAGHRPVGAYEILELLQNDGRRAAPPTVYRALEFLLDHGLVHRLESLNAFIGCPSPSGHHAGVFLICRDCRLVHEVHDGETDGRLDALASVHGFKPDRRVVEVAGLCAGCAKT